MPRLNLVPTETHHVGYCGSGKICYMREKVAWDAAEFMQEKYHKNFYAYFHPACCYYHVGKLRED